MHGVTGSPLCDWLEVSTAPALVVPPPRRLTNRRRSSTHGLAPRQLPPISVTLNSRPDRRAVTDAETQA